MAADIRVFPSRMTAMYRAIMCWNKRTARAWNDRYGGAAHDPRVMQLPPDTLARTRQPDSAGRVGTHAGAPASTPVHRRRRGETIHAATAITCYRTELRRKRLPGPASYQSHFRPGSFDRHGAGAHLHGSAGAHRQIAAQSLNFHPPTGFDGAGALLDGGSVSCCFVSLFFTRSISTYSTTTHTSPELGRERLPVYNQDKGRLIGPWS